MRDSGFSSPGNFLQKYVRYMLTVRRRFLLRMNGHFAAVQQFYGRFFSPNVISKMLIALIFLEKSDIQLYKCTHTLEKLSNWLNLHVPSKINPTTECQ